MLVKFTLLVFLLQSAERDQNPPVQPDSANVEAAAEVSPMPLAEPSPSIQESSEPGQIKEEVPPPEPAVVEEKDEFLALFEEPTIKYTGRGYKEREFTYRLFVPEIKSPQEKFPFIVWLHGFGERGRDNVRQLKFINEYVITPPYIRSRYPFFLLAVQCPRDNSHWTTSADDADDMLNVVIAALKKTLQENPAIDSSRISLIGVSAGGSGCWELAMRHPEVFSCVAPTGSGGGDNSRVSQLVGLPVWAFHSIRDRSTTIDGVRNTVEALKAVGGQVELTEVNSSDHFVWRMAFDDYDLLGWLLQQRRQPDLVPDASEQNFPLGSFAAVAGIILALTFLIWQIGRRRPAGSSS